MGARAPTYSSGVSELKRLLADRVVTSQAILDDHGKDESWLPPASPDAVAWPKTDDEAAEILRICDRERIPVVPFGTGTSLEGHVLATSGGICIDTSLMTDVVEINVDDLDATVQAGVTRRRLNDRLRDHGLFFPVDPGADASLGGMAATGASGTTTVRYGAMRENVLSLKVALPDGRVIKTGTRARKSSAGYDLTRLFIGSEGTLGIILDVTVRVYGIPEAIAAAVCSFDSIGHAVDTVITLMQLGVPVARAEMLDEAAMRAVNRHSGLGYDEAPTLFFEFHGTPQGVAEQAEIVKSVSADFGVVSVDSAVDEPSRRRLWRARHDAYFAGLALRPGSRSLTTDVCVPISSLSRCILDTQRDIEDATVPVVVLGHVGDGNFHLSILIDPDNRKEIEQAEEINHRLVKRALRLGGTCTGEHGVGIGKKRFLVEERGEAVDVMRAIKRALDPNNIMNPEKIFDMDGAL